MNVKEKIQSVLQKLNLFDKVKAKSLTNEDWQSIVNLYQQEYKVTLQEDMESEQSSQQNPLDQEALNQVQAILSGIVSGTSAVEGQENSGTQQENPKVKDASSAPATPETLVKLTQTVSDLVTAMKGQAAADIPLSEAHVSTIGFTGPADTSKYLFGIENAMFSMDARWNKITVNPRAASALEEADEETDGVSFRKQAVAYSRSLQKRYCYLHANNMLDPKRLAAGEFATNYEGVNTAGVGNQHVVLRQDSLIARVLSKRDLTQYFPVRYGIQDHDLVFNAFFSEVSQAYQTGEIWKGDMKIENEMGHVDDAMIKMKFGPMKELERIYIAYLNKEGSDPVKWSMIEFCILNSLETAQVEQNKRRMRGIYVKPKSGVAGSYLNAGTGILYTLLRYVHENKLLLHDNEAYRSYTSADMLESVQEFCADIVESCTEDMDLDKHVLYLNKLHQPWWIKNIRTVYGKDSDFTGTNGYLNTVPDTSIHIIWLPYLGQLPFMMMDVPGNIQFIEYIPGEMLAIKAKEDMELVKAWSTWKEGTAAAFLGRRFDSVEKLKENNYEWQQIFMNKFSVDLAADATTVDAKNGFWQITVANTKTTVATTINGAKEGVAYIIECGSTTNATTIAKSGKFKNITEAYTPTKVGDYIMVILDEEGNFLELERQVGGTRKINAALQPNIPGVR